MLAQSQE
jgi:hypothetical protein